MIVQSHYSPRSFFVCIFLLACLLRLPDSGVWDGKGWEGMGLDGVGLDGKRFVSCTKFEHGMTRLF